MKLELVGIFLVLGGSGRKRSGVGWNGEGTSTLDSEFEKEILVEFILIIDIIYTSSVP